jgi:dipeptidyl aminopeptidase/acylaminoacyl peptidase
MDKYDLLLARFGQINRNQYLHLPAELIILQNERHSLNNKESEIVYIARSLQFIQKYLMPVKD